MPDYMPAGLIVLCERARKAVPTLVRKKLSPSTYRTRTHIPQNWLSGDCCRCRSFIGLPNFTTNYAPSSALASVRRDFGKNLDWKIEALRRALIEKKAGDEEADDICLMARLVATKYNKPLSEVPKHWEKYLRWEKKEAAAWNKERQLRLNSPQTSELGKQIALLQGAQALMTESDITGHLEETTGSKRHHAKLRAMGKDMAAELIPLLLETGHLSLRADDSIWPASESIRGHLKEVKKAWRINEIIRVIKDLELEGKTPFAKYIAPRIYRSPDAQRRGKKGVNISYFRGRLVQEWREAKSHLKRPALSDFHSESSRLTEDGGGRMKRSEIDFDSPEEEEGRASKAQS